MAMLYKTWEVKRLDDDMVLITDIDAKYGRGIVGIAHVDRFWSPNHHAIHEAIGAGETVTLSVTFETDDVGG